MACRVVPVNLLSGLTATGETAATGYSNASLTDDVVAKAWRSSATASSFQVLIDRGASFVQMDWVGVFDLVPVTPGVAVTGVVLHDAPDGVAWSAELGRFIPNARGDGGKLVAITQRWLRYTVQLSAVSQIDWGLAFAGNSVDLPRTFSQRKQSKDRGVVVNDTEGGGTYTGRLRSYRHVIGLDFSILDDLQHQALEDLEDSTGGQFQPFMLQPSTAKPGELYHGRLEEVQSWTRNPGAEFYEGHSLAFRESGRGL